MLHLGQLDLFFEGTGVWIKIKVGGWLVAKIIRGCSEKWEQPRGSCSQNQWV